MTTPSALGIDGLMKEVLEFNSKVSAGIENLRAIKDDDVQIATAPKDEVLRTDKVTLHRYRPVTERRFSTPVLVVYSLIGRHTMTDLQEDRSLVRNLLAQGVDLWVVDWGNASRADRWLTIDDYVMGYLDECVNAMCEATGREKIGMLGICEGGVFGLAYAALEPERVQNLILTITPLDFHADMADDVSEQGLINVWTRSLTDEDVDQMIEVWGVLPGEFMSAIFSMLTPSVTSPSTTWTCWTSSMTRRSCSTSSGWRSGWPTVPTTPARRPNSGSRISTSRTSSSVTSGSWTVGWSTSGR